MIYLDTSVALAYLLGEDRQPPEALWRESLVASRLLEYELLVRCNARRLSNAVGEDLRALLREVTLLELSPAVCARALEPFPLPIRTLDALHLASIEWLRTQDREVALASYDRRLNDAATALKIPLARL